MHLWPKGFLDLVGKESRFQPLPWFKESQNDYSADRSWHELWEDYIREARRFNERQLTDIIGEQQARNWKFPVVWSESSQWDESFRLIVGEFIRRHHTRLAHEIAIYGFPGLPIGSGMDEFTALGKKGHPLENFADLIGITARSLREVLPRWRDAEQALGFHTVDFEIPDDAIDVGAFAANAARVN